MAFSVFPGTAQQMKYHIVIVNQFVLYSTPMCAILIAYVLIRFKWHHKKETHHESGKQLGILYKLVSP